MDIIVKSMELNHIDEVLNIYNYYINNTNINLSHYPISIENYKNKHFDNNFNFPKIVALKENTVVGFATLQAFRNNDGYNKVAELSIYVYNQMVNKKIGNILMNTILDKCKDSCFTSIISVITEENSNSINFHLKYNFKKVGHFEKIGFKNDKFFDVILLQKDLHN